MDIEAILDDIYENHKEIFLDWCKENDIVDLLIEKNTDVIQPYIDQFVMENGLDDNY